MLWRVGLALRQWAWLAVAGLVAGALVRAVRGEPVEVFYALMALWFAVLAAACQFLARYAARRAVAKREQWEAELGVEGAYRKTEPGYADAFARAFAAIALFQSCLWLGSLAAGLA